MHSACTYTELRVKYKSVPVGPPGHLLPPPPLPSMALLPLPAQGPEFRCLSFSKGCCLDGRAAPTPAISTSRLGANSCPPGAGRQAV